jgi:hypothetical protein
MTTRMLGPWNSVGKTPTCSVNGAAYQGWAVDAAQSDVAALTANGWSPVGGGSVAQSGATVFRLTTGLVAGQCFLDTTVQAVIVWDGAFWRNPVNGITV